jgi:ATP-dependent exoDNAse (exonuclease V) alpha subunit
LPFATGDRIQFTAGEKKLKVANRDHGYAVTSHSSQGLTAGRVLANLCQYRYRLFAQPRLAYVAISRASEDARIYTNNAETLGQ